MRMKTEGRRRKTEVSYYCGYTIAGNFRLRSSVFRLFFLLFFIGISTQATSQTTILNNTPPKPNILWIVCEDISPTLSFYGDSTAQTPILDQLAEESMVYENAFAPVGVCAPSRSAIITGMQPTSIGTMHMRTGKDIASWGKRKYKSLISTTDLNGDTIREYAAVLPEEIKCFTELLRANNYYCTNNDKTDYQFAAPISAWDQNNKKAHWRNRPKGKPFFSVFNINVTHESKLWKNDHLPLTVNPSLVPVPPYLPDDEATRKGIARHYSNVELMDAQVGKILEELKEDGLYGNTIIFFYSDHGGPLPRQKRAVYDSGLKVPFMMKSIGSKNKGRTDQLISFVDLAPTVLSLAGVEAPSYMEGKAFAGVYESSPRNYVYGSSDRFDEVTDRIRIVRNKRFLYVKNFLPEKVKYKDLAYRKKIPFMQSFLDLKEKGKLNEIQMQWFASKSNEELYDCHNDPHNLHNLAKDPSKSEILSEFRQALFEQMHTSFDWGQIPEAQMIDIMWPDAQQPKTETPKIMVGNGQITLTCATPGASIVYMVSSQANRKTTLNAPWQLYTQALKPKRGDRIYVLAERIGYGISELLEYEVDSSIEIYID